MTTTWAFMLIIAIAMIVFDVYIINKGGKEASISASVIRVVNANRLQFFIVLAIGVVLGHLFWSMPTESVYSGVECQKIQEVKQ